MSIYDIHLLEIEWIKKIQQVRAPWIDSIMFKLNLLDTFPFYALFLICLCFAYKKEFGLKLLFLFFITSYLNQNLKELIAEPRPCQMDVGVCLIQAKSYGFPSGAAQSFTVLLGYFCYQVRTKKIYLFSLFTLFLIGFSRIYLGLHFFTDILGGWFFGTMTLFLYFRFQPALSSYLSGKPRLFLITLAGSVSLLLAVFALNKNSTMVIYCALGVMVGLIYSNELEDPTHISQRILRPLVVLIGCGVLLSATVFIPAKGSMFLSACIKTFQFLTGVWISCWVNPVVATLEKKIFKNQIN